MPPEALEPTPLLETTLATDFVPGTNVRWQVTGGNWTFLLPSLEIERTVCFGDPTPATLATLERVSRSVEVVAMDRGHGGALPVAGGADLVVVADAALSRRLQRDSARLADALRLLRPGGRLYFEAHGRPGGIPSLDVAASRNGHHRPHQGSPAVDGEAFWLTPLAGEMHTAVPLADRLTVDYFLRHALYSLSSAALKRDVAAWLRWLTRRGRRSGPKSPTANAAPGDDGGGRPAPAAAAVLGRLAERAEHWLSRRRLLMRRFGVLVGTSTVPADVDVPRPYGSPPAYLRDIARAAGVDIGPMRWGLSARGAYSSRKVLVFLFAGDEPDPTYIVKMTRDPALNPRLENERRALAMLRDRGVGDDATLPRLVFHGRHGGLAIVGETIIQGVPFRARTRHTADCPYAAAAVDWLVDLGARTVDPSATTPADASRVLAELLGRFAAIYPLTPVERAFLDDQVAVVARHPGPFPTVCQHGDPGTWNLVATPDRRVAFLDWEAFEARGMPLWDLFYFLRSFGVGVARAQGTPDALAGFAAQFLEETPVGAMAARAVTRARAAVGVSGDLVAPLFHFCWLHRGLKEATRLPAERLAQGHYFRLLRLGIERRAEPVLARLLNGRPPAA